MTTQPTGAAELPEALEHAEGLESFAGQLPAYGFNSQPLKDAATHLRRQHALLNEQQRTIEALNACINGEGSTTTDNLRLVDRLHAENEALRAQPAGAATPAAPAPGAPSSADELARDLKTAIDTATELRQQLTLMEEHARGDVWRWQADGADDLSTMGNRMGVLIYASDLRDLLTAASQPPVSAGGSTPACNGRWAWVPVEPSTAMLIAGNHGRPGVFSALHVWQDMIAALQRSNDYTRPVDPPPAAAQEPLPAEAVERIVHLRANREKRVYIAGPMTGLPEFNFPAFNRAAARLRHDGWHVENPAEHGHVEGAGWADYLRWDISRIATCGAIYLLPGWSKSKGAILEVHIAQVLDLRVIPASGAEQPPSPQPAVTAGAVDALRTAAQAVVDRWDTPLWKDAPATAEYIGMLRAALAAQRATHQGDHK